MRECLLRHWAPLNGYGECEGEPTGHHLISRQFLRGNDEGRALVDGPWAHLFVVDICMKHHDNTNGAVYAGAEEIWRQLVETWGREYVATALAEVRATFKIPPPELRLSALLALETQTRIGDKSGGARDAA